MKTSVIFSATFLMFFTITTLASSPNHQLILEDAFGQTLTMPAITEEALEDNLPFDTESVFRQARQEDLKNNIDISGMVKPEQEVDDIPQNLKNVNDEF